MTINVVTGTLKIGVGIATAGRPTVLTAAISQLAKQTRTPDCLYICPVSKTDVEISCLRMFPGPSEIIAGPAGLTRQRNAIMRKAISLDILVFFDDDFLAGHAYIEEVEKLFVNWPDIVIATGHVLADGASGPGITVEQGQAILTDDANMTNNHFLETTYGAYGCNMAVRLSVATKHNVDFDERLPLYGWWEDVDFSRRLAPYGRVARSSRLRGVHLGSKFARSPGRRLGYSQVANPLYLMSKGSISGAVAFRRIALNVVANLGKSLIPEPWVDRRGRLVGNTIAFIHFFKGTLTPEYAAKL